MRVITLIIVHCGAVRPDQTSLLPLDKVSKFTLYSLNRSLAAKIEKSRSCHKGRDLYVSACRNYFTTNLRPCWM